jgi:hypothetical protein
MEVSLLSRQNNRPNVPPEEWTTTQVQEFFMHAENGSLRQFSSHFALVDGAMLCSLTRANLQDILPGAQGLVVHTALRNFHRGNQRRRLSSTGVDNTMEGLKMNEDGSFVPFFIVPSVITVLVAVSFITTSALLATKYQVVASSIVQCSPKLASVSSLPPLTPFSSIPSSYFNNKNSNRNTTTDSNSSALLPCQSVIIEYASIPIISVLFTYFHIWLALWLTFYPIRYVGCCQLPHDDKTWLAKTFGNMGLGWQGIIPFKAAYMARKSVQLMTSKLLDVREVFGRIDPLRVTEEIEPALHNLLGPIVDAVGREQAPVAWEIMPFSVKQEIIARAEQDTPSVITGMMQELTENIDQVFDLEEMVVATFIKDKMLLVEMFIKCGRSELGKFIYDLLSWA